MSRFVDSNTTVYNYFYFQQPLFSLILYKQPSLIVAEKRHHRVRDRARELLPPSLIVNGTIELEIEQEKLLPERGSVVVLSRAEQKTEKKPKPVKND